MTPTLPPLPLVDGCFLIDNSSLEALQTCPRAFEYSRLSKRISSADKPALSFGTAIHHALEWRYKNCRNTSPTIVDEEEMGKLLHEYFTAHPVTDDEPRNINLAIELMRRYNQKYHLEPFNVLVDDKGQTMVELSFALPLFVYKTEESVMVETGVISPEGIKEYMPDQQTKEIPVIYTGRIDLPVMWDDQLIIIDHKTTSMLGPQFFEEQKMSAQQLGYAWAFEQLTGKSVAGFCINGLRTRVPPVKPRSQTIDQWWDEALQRDIIYIRPEQLTEWKKNVIALIETFFWHYSRQYLPMQTKWCVGKYGKCPYFDVCSLPKQTRPIMLSSPVFTDNTWSPLK